MTQQEQAFLQAYTTLSKRNDLYAQQKRAYQNLNQNDFDSAYNAALLKQSPIRANTQKYGIAADLANWGYDNLVANNSFGAGVADTTATWLAGGARLLGYNDFANRADALKRYHRVYHDMYNGDSTLSNLAYGAGTIAPELPIGGPAIKVGTGILSNALKSAGFGGLMGGITSLADSDQSLGQAGWDTFYGGVGGFALGGIGSSVMGKLNGYGWSNSGGLLDRAKGTTNSGGLLDRARIKPDPITGTANTGDDAIARAMKAQMNPNTAADLGISEPKVYIPNGLNNPTLAAIDNDLAQELMQKLNDLKLRGQLTEQTTDALLKEAFAKGERVAQPQMSVKAPQYSPTTQQLINELEQAPTKGRDMPIIGKENLSDEILHWVVAQNKKVAINKLDSQKAQQYGFKYPDDVRRTIDRGSILHTLKRHGTKSDLVQKSGQKAVTLEDIKHWTDYADHADVEVLSKDALGNPIVLSGKQINGYYVVVESIRKTNNELAFKSMYFENGNMLNHPELGRATATRVMSLSSVDTHNNPTASPLNNPLDDTQMSLRGNAEAINNIGSPTREIAAPAMQARNDAMGNGIGTNMMSRLTNQAASNAVAGTAGGVVNVALDDSDDALALKFAKGFAYGVMGKVAAKYGMPAATKAGKAAFDYAMKQTTELRTLWRENPQLWTRFLNKQLTDDFAQFGGQKAGLHAERFAVAQTLASKGVGETEILERTGWFKGLDGNWKFQIDLSNGAAYKLREGTYSLVQLFKQPSLYQAYPFLKKMRVSIQPMPENVNGYFELPTLTIHLNSANNKFGFTQALSHEVQHIIQQYEGFAVGTSKKDPNYWTNAGEVEARATFKAGENNPQQRLNNELMEGRIIQEFEKQAPQSSLRTSNASAAINNQGSPNGLGQTESAIAAPAMQARNDAMGANNVAHSQKLEDSYLNKATQKINTEALNKHATPLPKPLSQQEFMAQAKTDTQGIARVQTPIGEVNVHLEGAWKHMSGNNSVEQNRTYYSGAFWETITDPLFVVRQDYIPQTQITNGRNHILPQDSYVFFKPFANPNGAKYLAAFALDKNGNLTNTTFFAPNMSKIKQWVKSHNDDLLYYKFAPQSSLRGNAEAINNVGSPTREIATHSVNARNDAIAQNQIQQALRDNEVFQRRLKNIPKDKQQAYLQDMSEHIATKFPNHDSQTAIDAHLLMGEIRENYAWARKNKADEVSQPLRQELESLLNIHPTKEFGTNYAEFYHDGQNAIGKLMHEKQGQVAGAFYREDLQRLSGNGNIDLVWGEVTDATKHKGYGLAHIRDKHPELDVNLIPEIVEKGELVNNAGVNTIIYKEGDKEYRVGLSRGWQGKGDNEWVITSYIREPHAQNFDQVASKVGDGHNLHQKANDIIPQNPNNQQYSLKSPIEKLKHAAARIEGIKAFAKYLANPPEHLKADAQRLRADKAAMAELDRHTRKAATDKANAIDELAYQMGYPEPQYSMKNPRQKEKFKEDSVGLVEQIRSSSKAFADKILHSKWVDVPLGTRIYTKGFEDYRGIKDSFDRDIAANTSAALDLHNKLKLLSEDNQRKMYQYMSGDLKGEELTKDIRELADEFRKVVRKETDELVKLGLLNEDTAKKWGDIYIMREYSPRVTERIKRAFGGGRSEDYGIGLDSIHMRGKKEKVSVEKYQEMLANGEIGDITKGKWEVLHKPTKHEPKYILRRDYTKSEREKMGEIELISTALPRTLAKLQNQKRIAVLFDTISKDSDLAVKLDKGQEVPSGFRQLRGEQFGALRGFAVRNEVADDIERTTNRVLGESKEVLAMAAKLATFWKKTKTIHNPTSHINNMIGNVFFMLIEGEYKGIKYATQGIAQAATIRRYEELLAKQKVVPLSANAKCLMF